MSPRHLSCLIAACIVFFISSTAAYGQSQCLPPADLALFTTWQFVPPHPAIPFLGNLRFVSVNYSAGQTPSEPMMQVLKDAVGEWNKLTCTTGIYFFPSAIQGHSGAADVYFFQTTNDSVAGFCARYVVPGQNIFYGPSLLARLAAPVPAGGYLETRAVIMHELGHFLGLNDTSTPPFSPSIMSQGTCSTPSTVTFLSNADAQKVAECLNSAPTCYFNITVAISIYVCEEQGGFWNFTSGGCFPDPQPPPCEECLDNNDCCNGDVCHNGVCGPPECLPLNCECTDCPEICFRGFCSEATPILIDIDGDGFQLTNVAGGVDFDFEGDGSPRRIAWTAAGADDAWLVLDRNHNGRIDSAREMFGNLSPQPAIPQNERNGFLALAEFDKTSLGGNGDGEISRKDYIFRELRLWTDANHNGVAEPSELSTLEGRGLHKLELDYKESRRRDQYGNRFRYRAQVKDARDAQIGRWAWDVSLKVRN